MARPELLRILTAAVSGAIAQFSHGAASCAAPTPPSPEARRCEVAGVIRLEGDGVAWEVWLGFPRDSCTALAQRAFASVAEPQGDFEAETVDLAGEMLNIAFGTLDPQFRGLGLKMRSSLPVSYAGAELEALASRRPDRSVFMVGQSAYGAFMLEIFAGGSLPVMWRYTSG